MSQLALGGTVLKCEWCQETLPFESQKTRRFCSQKCRQWAHRTRKRKDTARVYGKPMRFRYDDPPFVGRAWRYYKMPEVDHAELIRDALSQKYDGYALSCSMDSLRKILPMFPDDVELHICPWLKPHKPWVGTKGLHNCWEAVIIVGGRQEPPGQRDWFSGLPARHGGDLPGRKTVAFAVALYKWLGAGPGDTLFEKFRGTGIVGRVWAELQRADAMEQPFDPSEPSLLQDDDGASPMPADDSAAPSLSAGVDGPASVSSGSDVDGSAASSRPGGDAKFEPDCFVCGDDPNRCELQEGCVLADGEGLTPLVQVKGQLALDRGDR